MTSFRLRDSDKCDSVLFFDAILFFDTAAVSKGMWAAYDMRASSLEIVTQVLVQT